MRKAPRLLLPLVATSLALLAALGPATAEPTTQVFDAKNFKWTVPDGWEFAEFSDADRELGYVVRASARKDDAYAVADVRVKATEGLSLHEITEEVRGWHSQQMTTLQGSKTREGSLSGLKGTEVLVKGEDETGATKLVRAYTIEAGGMFHQLIFKLYGGAETKMAAQVDEARRGYRLLKGAGPMEQAGDIGGGRDDDAGTNTPDNWPEKGPKFDNGVLTFEHYNFKWKLTPDNKLKLVNIINDQSKKPEQGKSMLVAGFRGEEAREARKDGEPTQNVMEVLLFLQKSEPGFDPNAFVEASGLHNNIAENLFDNVEFGRTKAKTDHEIGNHKGGRLAMAGRKDENVRYFVLYAVGLKGLRYQWEIRADGGREAFQVFQDDLEKLMDGLEFQDTAEWIAGPIGVQGVAPFDMPRGDSQGEEREYTSVGFTAVKPPELSSITPDEQKPQNLRYAWEMRSEDKQQYFYFDIHSFPLTGRERDPEEEIVNSREMQWKQATQNPETIKKGRTPGFKDKLGKAKGLGYEFTGYVDNKPFVERGYVVKYKKYLYWVRFQFGGEGAEKAFSKLQKSIAKDIKY